MIMISIVINLSIVTTTITIIITVIMSTVIIIMVVMIMTRLQVDNILPDLPDIQFALPLLLPLRFSSVIIIIIRERKRGAADKSILYM